MTRSFHAHKQATSHDYKIATSPTARSIKRSGAGKHSWGSEQELIDDGVQAVRTDTAPLSVSPQEAKASFESLYRQQRAADDEGKTMTEGVSLKERHASVSSTSSGPSTSSASEA